MTHSPTAPPVGSTVVGGGGAVPAWARYVALGDSFTEGLWDSDPAAPDVLYGWADRLAARLSQRRRASGQSPVDYANLAIRGKLLPAILTEQVPRALAMKPELVSLVGGGNDVMRPAVDVDQLALDLEAAVVRFRSAGIDVLLGTGVDTVETPLLKATRGRTAVLNSHVWSIARRHGAYVLDLWGMRCLRDWRMWHEDRIHLTPEGHARVTQAALVGLGLAPDDASWDDPLAPLPDVPRGERLLGDLDWLREHAYPWATRRLRGASSGRDRAPKQLEYRRVDHVPATRPKPELLDDDPLAGEDGLQAEAIPEAIPQAAEPSDGRHEVPHDDVRKGRDERISPVIDRIDFTTSDDPELPGEVSGIRSTRHSGDVLHGGHPEDAPVNASDVWRDKAGLVGASPDGDPDQIEAYESGQDDGQMN